MWWNRDAMRKTRNLTRKTQLNAEKMKLDLIDAIKWKNRKDEKFPSDSTVTNRFPGMPGIQMVNF